MEFNKEFVQDLCTRNPSAAISLLRLFDRQLEVGLDEWITADQLREIVDKNAETKRKVMFVNKFSHALSERIEANHPLQRCVESMPENAAPGTPRTHFQINKDNMDTVTKCFNDRDLRHFIEGKFLEYLSYDREESRYFSKQDFDLLKKFAGKKYDKDIDSDIKAKSQLNELYKLTEYWASMIIKDHFPAGKVVLRKSSINQGQYFEHYHWAKIYPDMNSFNIKNLAFTVAAVEGKGFEIKIDTVNATKQQRSIYEKVRGDFDSSPITKIISIDEGINEGWEWLIKQSVHFIERTMPNFESLLLQVQDKKNNEERKNKTNGDSGGSKKMALNQILYGPPGTGKTYNTVLEAVKICDPSFDGNYNEAKEGYKILKAKGRIEFITFHQSYGYEEFIEGIKPVLNADDNSDSIAYKVEQGVFKCLARKAEVNRLNSNSSSNDKVDIELLLNDFANDVQEKILKDENLLLTIGEGFKNKSYIGEVKIDSDESFKSFITTGSVKNQSLTKSIIFRDYQLFYDGKIKSYKDIKPTHKSKATYHGNAVYYYQLFLVMQAFQSCSEEKYLVDDIDKILKPYVLIIDEINRGNMSKVFGELITLIEADKRIGADHSMTVRLPVSGDEFGVPKNLHIIGTMNTADRSIAMMDTALRRRFEFKEMMPDPELLADICVEGVDLKTMLQTLNDRIEILYDREHTIGHAYFMSLNSESTIQALASVFENKVIPLLAEYFFEDWEKIRMVLGDDQKNIKHQFIKENNGDKKGLFGPAATEVIDWESLKTYSRNADALAETESYIGIYERKKTEIQSGADQGESNSA